MVMGEGGDSWEIKKKRGGGHSQSEERAAVNILMHGVSAAMKKKKIPQGFHEGGK